MLADVLSRRRHGARYAVRLEAFAPVQGDGWHVNVANVQEEPVDAIDSRSLNDGINQRTADSFRE